MPIALSGRPGRIERMDAMNIASKDSDRLNDTSPGDGAPLAAPCGPRLKRVLFVDDEDMVLLGLRRLLRAGGKPWELEFSLGGEAALRACEVNSFDVVVSDMRMPGMDGLELLTEIRDRFPGTARMILSGYSAPQSALSAVGVAHRFLSKPCDAAELESAIERVCVLRDALNSEELQKVVGVIGPLPSLSETFRALTKLIESPAATVRQVADVVRRDPPMAAKVLQLVNSAFFGPAQTVSSLHVAVSHLGMSTIRNLVLVADAFRVFTPGPQISSGEVEALWEHSRRAALIAGKLPMERSIRELTVIAALLHDIGRLVLMSKMPAQFCAVRALVREKNCAVFEAEQQLLGVSHAEIGAYLLGLWGIPVEIVDAVLSHHRPVPVAGADFGVLEAVFVADLLAHEALPEDGVSYEMREPDRICLEQMGLLDRLPEFRRLALEDEGQTA